RGCRGAEGPHPPFSQEGPLLPREADARPCQVPPRQRDRRGGRKNGAERRGARRPRPQQDLRARAQATGSAEACGSAADGRRLVVGPGRGGGAPPRGPGSPPARRAFRDGGGSQNYSLISAVSPARTRRLFKNRLSHRGWPLVEGGVGRPVR